MDRFGRLSLMRETLIQLQEMLQARFGFAAFFGFELEWYVRPADASEEIAALHEAILIRASEMGLGVESISDEKGEGQYEAAFTERPDGLDLVDCVGEFKGLLVREAEKLGLQINLAAKPFAEDYGSALQAHISLVDESGAPLFTKQDEELSPPLAASLSGLMAILPESLVYAAPFPQSYARFVPGFDAPLTVSWGGNNRSVALRLPRKKPPFTQIEYRVGGADADPATLLALVLAGVLHGLEAGLPLHEQIHGIAHDAQYALPRLPSTLEEAKAAHDQGGVLKRYLG